MRTYKHRYLQTKRRKTIKGGGASPNETASLVVRKSRLDIKETDLLYKLIISRPAFPFLDYLNYNMNLVDEGLAELKSTNLKKDENGDTIKEKENIVFINKIEYGNNKTKNAKKLEKTAEREE